LHFAVPPDLYQKCAESDAIYEISFEHSLVEELGYNGFERLRRGFDKSFGGRENVPTFAFVIDAGCGTGLVGEQVSSGIERYRIFETRPLIFVILL
jgi:predicted TPR repeat methyltransferase